MTRNLLWAGMLSGLVAALCAALFAKIFAEPQVDFAIGFESAQAIICKAVPEPEPVSRAVQSGIGLLTAVCMYGTALGGLFAIVFAIAYGRVSQSGPRTLALTMAVIGFCAVAVVPALKYPPNPPAVGNHDTVAMRTTAYFLMLFASGLAITASIRLRRWLAQKLSPLDATLVALGVYGLIVVVASCLLPNINEVPTNFPATVLWNFRIASLATQAALWAVTGLGFGPLAERILRLADGH